jgi:ubiquinone/menaquinone biosynthesis C-methylase UbiE
VDDVSQTDLAAEWRALVPAWIARVEAGKSEAREGLLDDWMLDLAGDVSLKRVIDLGCGEGRFSRMLGARGATVVGVDLQPAFVEYARARGGPRETYVAGDMQRLDGFDDASFDLAVSYITLVDVPDMGRAVAEAARVVRPGGRFLVCNVSPMATAAQQTSWLRDEDGNKLHYVLDDYTTEGPRTLQLWEGGYVTNFHRQLSTTLNTFIEAGFELVALHEPTPNKEQLARVPAIEDLYRVPIFTIYDLRRRAG